MKKEIDEIAKRWKRPIYEGTLGAHNVAFLVDEIERLEDVCARLQRDRNELAAVVAFVREDYLDTLHMTEDAIAMRGRLALVDGLRALLDEANAEIVTLRAMSSAR